MNIIQANDEFGPYIEYPLNKGYVTLISPEDLEFVQQRRWWMHKSGYVVGKQKVAEGGKHLKLHRELFKYWGEDIEGLVVDHINGVKEDNRRLNLRAVDIYTNSQNMHKHWGEVEYRGVFLDKRTGRYRTQIGIFNKRYRLGYYATAELAAMAYDLFILENCPENVYHLNFPKEKYEGLIFEVFQKQHTYQPTSQYRGVHKVRTGWKARIRIPNKKEKRGGVYKDEQKAAIAVDLLFLMNWDIDYALKKLNFSLDNYDLTDFTYNGMTLFEFKDKYSNKEGGAGHLSKIA